SPTPFDEAFGLSPGPVSPERVCAPTFPSSPVGGFRLGALSTNRSQSPVSSTVHHAFPRAHGVSLRGRTRRPASTGIFLHARLYGLARLSLVPACCLPEFSGHMVIACHGPLDANQK